ncbi:MAG: DUF421 domain-containing protein [Bacteroidales bacterium]|nr:DUF421 domain-containing protein [Bacteroidales bacterium]
MFDNTYLNIVISSAAVYLFITIAIRIFGKKELAQLSVVDLIFILLISNAVQTAMVGPDTTLQGGLVAATTLFLLNYLFKYLLFRSKFLADLIEGEPLILVLNGKVQDKNLRKEKISVNELLEVVREHGVMHINDVNLAILEVDGNISVLSDDYKHRTVSSVASRRKHTKKGSSIS